MTKPDPTASPRDGTERERGPAPAGSQPPKATPRKSIDQQLDEALADSFPASDPVSFVTSQTEEDWEDKPPESPT